MDGFSKIESKNPKGLHSNKDRKEERKRSLKGRKREGMGDVCNGEEVTIKYLQTS